MGLAWVSDDANSVAPPVPERVWAVQEYAAGPRHRRPTLLARSGQAMVGRISALAGTHPATLQPGQHAAGAQRSAAHRYWD